MKSEDPLDETTRLNNQKPILVGFVFNSLLEPMAVQFHCMIEKRFQFRRKKKAFSHSVFKLRLSTSEVSTENKIS